MDTVPEASSWVEARTDALNAVKTVIGQAHVQPPVATEVELEEEDMAEAAVAVVAIEKAPSATTAKNQAIGLEIARNHPPIEVAEAEEASSEQRVRMSES